MSDDLDRQVSDAVADGTITPDDAAAVLKFRDFLRAAGGPPNRARVRKMLDDPQWRGYILGEQ